MHIRVLILLFIAVCALPAHARDWVDVSGHYHFSGELLAGNDKVIILEKPNKDLLSVDIKQLSDKDRAFIQERARKAATDPKLQTWTSRDGLKFRASVVDYAKCDLVVRQVRRKAYIDNKKFDNLPGVYRKFVPAVVADIEGIAPDEDAFKKWVKTIGGTPRKYPCEGVTLEFENGDLYTVPFVLFSTADLKILKPGWEKWSKAKDDKEAQERYSLSLQAQSVADRRETEEGRKVAKLQLQLGAYQAGLFDLWDVILYPPQGTSGMAMNVVVPGRNSDQARIAALQKYGNHKVGPISKVRRRRY